MFVCVFFLYIYNFTTQKFLQELHVATIGRIVVTLSLVSQRKKLYIPFSEKC